MPAQAALPQSAISFVLRWWHGLDKTGWRSFFIAIFALAAGLLLSIYSAAAA